MSRRRNARAQATTCPAAPAVVQIAQPDEGGQAAPWREHDLMIRRFHIAGLAPDEIAVILNSRGLKVRTWHVGESFVRGRLKALSLPPNASRLYYSHGQNRYRDRPER